MIKKRYEMSSLSVKDLKDILFDRSEIIVFSVFMVEGLETRYRLEVPKDDEGFINLISNKLTIGFDGIDSGSYSFLECDFIDVYTKYPI